MIEDCNFKVRDEEFKKRKELETDKANKNKGEQLQQGKDITQTKANEREEKHKHNNNEGNYQEQNTQQKEEGWKTQKRRNTKQQVDRPQKSIWRPTSPQSRQTREHQINTAQQTGITNNHNQNAFTNLHMQEEQKEDREGPFNTRGTPPQETQNRRDKK
ncbi:hypothetical protein R3W88_008041 [Solanum pinnatisectum]|uniref:Uncharacterized protein n=1 Tax=Solanum pinnatisectum TaxID=50273 RepID=A0AAV9M6T0_9SOLN|nr:hypothetical protein R3W88_008041 [Solanum pinnatisectum]